MNFRCKAAFSPLAALPRNNWPHHTSVRSCPIPPVLIREKIFACTVCRQNVGKGRGPVPFAHRSSTNSNASAWLMPACLLKARTRSSNG